MSVCGGKYFQPSEVVKRYRFRILNKIIRVCFQFAKRAVFLIS